jgi:hypothetical protein
MCKALFKGAGGGAAAAAATPIAAPILAAPAEAARREGDLEARLRRARAGAAADVLTSPQGLGGAMTFGGV